LAAIPGQIESKDGSVRSLQTPFLRTQQIRIAHFRVFADAIQDGKKFRQRKELYGKDRNLAIKPRDF
jgi:hypothetical protein